MPGDLEELPPGRPRSRLRCRRGPSGARPRSCRPSGCRRSTARRHGACGRRDRCSGFSRSDPRRRHHLQPENRDQEPDAGRPAEQDRDEIEDGAPVRLNTAPAVIRISTTVMPTAIRGLTRPTMPMTIATRKRVIPIPAGERGLVVLAEGANGEFLQPLRSELDEGLAERGQRGGGGLKDPDPLAEGGEQLGDADCRPIATTPTSAAAATPGGQARGLRRGTGAVVAGRSLVVMPLVRRAVQKGWVDAPATFQGADFAGRNGRLMVHLRHCRS